MSRRATRRATRRRSRRTAGELSNASQAGERLSMSQFCADPGLVDVADPARLLVVVLASGVWIAVALDHRRLRRDAADDQRADRLGAGDDDVERERVVDAGRAAAVHLDGRDPVPHQAVGEDVPWPVAVAAVAAGPADACERHRLRDIRGGLRLLGRDLRDHRQDRAARIEKRGYDEAHQPRLARRLRHARAC